MLGLIRMGVEYIVSPPVLFDEIKEQEIKEMISMYVVAVLCGINHDRK